MFAVFSKSPFLETNTIHVFDYSRCIIIIIIIIAIIIHLVLTSAYLYLSCSQYAYLTYLVTYLFVMLLLDKRLCAP